MKKTSVGRPTLAQAQQQRAKGSGDSTPSEQPEITLFNTTSQPLHPRT